MHELSLAEEMLDIILEYAKQDTCAGIRRVHLSLGNLSHVEVDALRFCFESVVKGSLADGAALVITRVPAKGKCPSCLEISAPAQLYDPCPHCGQFGLTILSGQDLNITAIEVI